MKKVLLHSCLVIVLSSSSLYAMEEGLIESRAARRNAIPPKEAIEPEDQKVKLLSATSGDLTILQRSLRIYREQLGQREQSNKQKSPTLSPASTRVLERKPSLTRGLSMVSFRQFFKRKADPIRISDIQATNIQEVRIEDTETSLPVRFEEVAFALEMLHLQVLALPLEEIKDGLTTFLQFKESFMKIVSRYNKGQEDQSLHPSQNPATSQNLPPEVNKKPLKVEGIGRVKFLELRNKFENKEPTEVFLPKDAVFIQKPSKEEIAKPSKEEVVVPLAMEKENDVPPLLVAEVSSSPPVKQRSHSSPLRQRFKTWTNDLKSSLRGKPNVSSNNATPVQRRVARELPPEIEILRYTFAPEEVVKLRTAIALSLSEKVEREGLSQKEYDLFDLLGRLFEF